MTARQPRLSSLAVGVALALGACDRPAAPERGTPPQYGEVRTKVSSALTSQGVAHATVTIRPGAGSYFAPMIAELSRAEAGWAASVSSVPAGPGRRVDVVASDAGGDAVFTGSASMDVLPGATSTVTLVLQQAAAPQAPVISNPVVRVGTPVPAVAPGGAAQFTAAVTDPGGLPVTSLWSASCGTFVDPLQRAANWVAPTVPYQRCAITFTAWNPYASTSVSLAVDVLPDPSTRSVMGRRLETCWRESATSGAATTTTILAPDVSTLAAPDVLVQTAPGTWTRWRGGHVEPGGVFVPGSFGADGSFYVPGLPQSGPYLLSFADPHGAPLLVETSYLWVDLGYDRIGRCDPASPAPGTSVSLQLAGLDAWDPGASALQAASSDVDAFASIAVGSELTSGATVAALSVPWTAPLLSGDGLWVSQVSPATGPGGVVYRRASRFGSLGRVSLVDGGATALATALALATQSGLLDVHWSTGSFEQALPDLAPAARVVSSSAPPHRMSISALPLAEASAPLPTAGALELAALDAPTGTGSVDLASPLPYGRFLPSPWSEWREVRFGVSAGYRATPASALLEEASWLSRRDALPAAAGMVGPLLGPVLAPLVNSADAFADQVAVTATPTLSWAPPASGAPTLYQVEIFVLSDVGGQTVATPCARYLTASTSATLPPDVLVGPGPFFARITAIAAASPTILSPLRSARTEARATVLTGTFVP
jgi:hypothetical protein